MTVPVIRILEPLSLLFPKGDVCMPPGATADRWILCGCHSDLPPARAVWVAADGLTGLCPVCQACDCADEELERRVIDQVSKPAFVRPTVEDYISLNEPRRPPLTLERVASLVFARH